MNSLLLKKIIVFVGFMLIGFYNSTNAATIYFNVIYSGTVSTSSITNIATVSGSGFSFTSVDPNSPVFVVTSGNDIGGSLSYINSSNQVISMNGVISRQNKTGSITNGLFFYPASNPSVAYILVVPGREGQFTSGLSYGSSSDTGNTITAMNEILTTQGTQPVLQINSPFATEGDVYLLFEISFTNNFDRTGTSTFEITANAGSASLITDFTENLQYSYDQLSWSAVSGSLSFPTSEEKIWLRVPLVNDTIKECTESLTLESGPVSGGNVLNNGGAFGVGTIYDLEDYYVWNGTISTVWNNSENWMCGDIPVSGGNVVISGTALNNLVLDQDHIIGYLKFCNSGKKVLPMSSVLTASIIHHADNNNYIQTTGLGYLNMKVELSVELRFPVGNSAYNPILITNNSAASDYFSVRVKDEMFNNGYDGTIYDDPRVIRTWFIDKETPNNGSGVDLTFNWNTGEEINLLNPRMFHYNGAQWEIPSGQINTSVNTLSYYNYTGTFSPFAIADGGTEMAVSMDYFNVICKENARILSWQTISEINNDKYIIESSQDCLTWKKMDEIQGAGNSTSIQNYYYEVEEVRDLIYYRLIQQDYDGESTIYGPISSVCDFDTTNYSIFPNPSNGDFFIKLESVAKETIEIKITRLDGSVIKKQMSIVAKGMNLIPIKSEDLAKGNYMLSITNEKGTFVQSLSIR